ncbi:MAG: TetR/AcrR family transcriptional regulator [Myxococcales bacterium]|nr:TetR/AcrR family transcriptional regulator [Myxococcales bacterium]
MPQVLKEEVRRRILAAALEAFAAHGYASATITAIAERAGIGAASLYRYYPSKAELFAAVVPAELAARFEALLEGRVEALAHLADPVAPRRGNVGAEELLDFWIEARLAVVILLDRAAGTAYARYGERFVELLTSATIAQIEGATPGIEISAPARFVLERIFEGTRRTLAAILEAHADEPALRQAIAAFWSYQLPGLAGFSRWVRETQA